MYYISGKNFQNPIDGSMLQGWSVVDEQGIVVTTINGPMGLLAAQIVCEELNKNPEKIKGPRDSKKLCHLNYEDNKIFDNNNNVAVLEALYYSTVGDITIGYICDNKNMNASIVIPTLNLLIDAGWVRGHNSYIDHSNEKHIEADHYRLSFMGKVKLEWLTGVAKST